MWEAAIGEELQSLHKKSPFLILMSGHTVCNPCMHVWPGVMFSGQEDCLLAVGIAKKPSFVKLIACCTLLLQNIIIANHNQFRWY